VDVSEDVHRTFGARGSLADVGHSTLAVAARDHGEWPNIVALLCELGERGLQHLDVAGVSTEVPLLAPKILRYGTARAFTMSSR